MPIPANLKQVAAILFGTDGVELLMRAGAFTPGTSAAGVLNALLLSIYNSTLPTYTNGQFGTPQMDSRGSLHTNIMSLDGTAGANVNTAVTGDGSTTSVTGLVANAYNLVFGGATWDRLRTPKIFTPLAAVNTNAEITILTPTSAKKFRLMRLCLVSTIAGNITIRDNTAGTIIAIIPSGAGGSGVWYDFGNGILSASANNVLTAQGPLTSTMSGMLATTEE